MVEPPPSDVPDPIEPPPVPIESPRASRTRRTRAGGVLVAAGIVLVVGITTFLATRSAGPTTGPGPGPTPGTRPISMIALVDPSGGLALEDPAGHRSILSEPTGSTFGFPAWSPDGSRVAAVDNGASDAAIEIFTIPRDGTIASPGPAPLVVYRSSAIPPFYLSWAPDGKRLSFLATEADGISLRVAPADGSAPLDGSGPGGVIRRGAPLYFDWTNADHLLLHVGSGAGAFLGEVGLDGMPVAPAIGGSGDFRPAVVSADGTSIAYVRGQVPSGEVVVSARDGSAEHAFPVRGPAAVVWNPAGDRLAAIGASEPTEASLAFPIGPLRLVDPRSGDIQTLIDGSVVGFFWSPDGGTIAALRLQTAGGSTEAERPVVLAAAVSSPIPASIVPSAGPTVAPSPTPTAAAGQTAEIHLLFVDVATSKVRSDRVVQLTSHFINQFLPYFDQYALSHHVWAADSSAILLPLIDDTGQSHLVVLPPDGNPNPRTLEGVSGFWSP